MRVRDRPMRLRDREPSIAEPPVAADPGRAPNSTEDDRWLGLRLRSLRKERKMSIQALADRSGLSTGMLSQIERGLSTPSVKSLRLLAAALTVPIPWFFMAPEVESIAPSPHVVRRGRRRALKLAANGVMKELLTPSGPGVLEIYEIVLQPGCGSGAESYSHPGSEKAGVVVEGALRLWLDNAPTVLETGDSFRFPSHLAHRFDNCGTDLARVIWIVAARVDPAARPGQSAGPSQSAGPDQSEGGTGRV